MTTKGAEGARPSRPPRRIDPRAYAPRLALPLAVLLAVLVGRLSHFWMAAAWGLVMLLSFKGWGDLVAHLLRPTRPVDVGLRLGWGLAATLAVGSLACMVHVASRPFLIGQQVLGCVLATVFALRAPPPRPRAFILALARPSAYLIVAVAMCGVAVEYLGQLATTWQEPSDDPPLYFYMPEKIVQTGTFFEPYAVRRITTYGGQVYLHALFLAVGRHYQLNVVDAGVGTSAVLALLVGGAAPKGLRRAHLVTLVLVVFVLLTIRDVRFNVAAEMTGLVACLAAYRTLLWIGEDPGETRGHRVTRTALVAACAIAACVLRTSNAVAIALFLAIAFAQRALRGSGPPGERLRSAARELVLLAGLAVLFLAPWLVLLNESVGTFIYPLRHGNITAGFTIVKPEPGLAYNLKHILRDINHDRPFALPKLALVCGLIPLARGGRAREAFLPALCIVTFLCICLMSYVGGGFDEAVNSRYYFAFLMCAVFAVVLSIPYGDAARPGLELGSRAALIAAVAVAHVALAHDEARKRAAAQIDFIERAASNSAAEAQADEYATQNYRDVQYHVPAGGKIVVAVAEPFRFDMRRNAVWSLDQPGAIGPKGAYPVFGTPDDVAAYLLGNGVGYIIAMDFHKGHELLDIERWKRHASLTHSFLNYESPYMVAGMENIEKLAQSRRVIYEMFNMRVIDLAALR